MASIERPAKEFKRICIELGYRRKTLIVQPTLSVTLMNLNWSGGSRNMYSAVDILSGESVTPHLGVVHPMDNDAEGAKIAMRPGTLIAEHGIFQGKPAKMRIFCHPDDMPKLIGE